MPKEFLKMHTFQPICSLIYITDKVKAKMHMHGAGNGFKIQECTFQETLCYKYGNIIFRKLMKVVTGSLIQDDDFLSIEKHFVNLG